MSKTTVFFVSETFDMSNRNTRHVANVHGRGFGCAQVAGVLSRYYNTFTFICEPEVLYLSQLAVIH